MGPKCQLYLYAIIFAGTAACIEDTSLFDGVMFFQVPLGHIPMPHVATVEEQLPAKLKPLAYGRAEKLQKKGLDAYRFGQVFKKHLAEIGKEMYFDDPAHRGLARQMATIRRHDPLKSMWRPKEHIPRTMRRSWVSNPPKFVNPLNQIMMGARSLGNPQEDGDWDPMANDLDSTDMYPDEIMNESASMANEQYSAGMYPLAITKEPALPIPRVRTQDMPRTTFQDIKEHEHVRPMPRTRTQATPRTMFQDSRDEKHVRHVPQSRLQDVRGTAYETKRKHNFLDAAQRGFANQLESRKETENVSPRPQTRMPYAPRTMLDAKREYNHVDAIHQRRQGFRKEGQEEVEPLQEEQESMQEYADISDQEDADTSDQEYVSTSDQEYVDTSDQEYVDASEHLLPVKKKLQNDGTYGSQDWLEVIRQDVKETEEELEDEEAIDNLDDFDPDELNN